LNAQAGRPAHATASDKITVNQTLSVQNGKRFFIPKEENFIWRRISYLA